MPLRHISGLPRRAGLSRRVFLARAGMIGGGLVAFGAGGVLRAGRAGAQPRRSTVYHLVLDGERVGPIEAFTGGMAKSEVIEEAGADGVRQKHLGAIQFEPIRIHADLGAMSPSFFALLHNFLNNRPRRVQGAIEIGTPGGLLARRVEFRDAFVIEVTFPALDNRTRDAAYVEVVFAPELTRWVEAKDEEKLPSGPKPARTARRSNFRLRIEGLDESCAAVERVAALTARQPHEITSEGGLMPGRLELPNLVVTLPAENARAFQDWHRSFVLEGESSGDAERQGTVELLGEDLQELLYALTFEHLGIVSYSVSEEGDEGARATVEMYCEALGLAAVAPA